MIQGTFDFGEPAASPPVKLCECGCGLPAPLAKQTDAARGYVKGEPHRFIRGHARGPRRRAARDGQAAPGAASPPPAGVPAKLCECGCGQPTPVAKRNNRKLGHVKGQPTRFKVGHHLRHRRGGSPRELLVEAGQRIGRSTVIDPEVTLQDPKAVARAARLRCECGAEYVRRLKVIFKKPDDESCGDCFEVDLTGQVIGRLTVLRWTRVRDANDRRTNGRWRSRWLCECKCGKEIHVTNVNLVRRRLLSCGCGTGGPRKGLPAGEAEFIGFMGEYQRGAQVRGLSWDLGREDFERLTGMDCHYCGAAPSMPRGRRLRNGLDRADNSQGYLLQNVHPCCTRCNRAKGAMGYGEFIAYHEEIAAYCQRLAAATALRDVAAPAA